MAKKVGSEDAPKMGAPAVAGAGGNQVVTPELYLKAVKDIVAARQIMKEAALGYKGIRKSYGGAGIQLGVLDSMVKIAEWSRGEIRDHFEVQARYAEWLGLPVAPGVLRQGDILKGLADDEVQRREWFAIGRTASRTGKSSRPPEECPPEFTQAFLAGYNEEDEAAWLDSETPDRKEDPPSDEPGSEPPSSREGTVDWTGPEWAQFAEDPEDWFAAQKSYFLDAYGELPAGSIVRISNVGVLKAFREARAVEEMALGEGESPEELPIAEGDDIAQAAAQVAARKAEQSKKSVH